MERGKAMLLQCATPDAVARLPSTSLAGEASDIWDKYFCQQQHSSLASYLSYVLNHQDPVLEKRRKDGLLLQVCSDDKYRRRSESEVKKIEIVHFNFFFQRFCINIFLD